MKLRLTSWLAALLVMSATLGLPVTRVVTNRVCCCQVYCERKKQLPEEFSETRERTRPALPAYAPAALPGSFPARLLDYSLFQRPPPSPSIARL